VKPKPKAQPKAKPKAQQKAGAARPQQAAPAPPAARSAGRLKVRPLRDRVLVRRLEEADEKIGRIIVPDTAKEKPQSAEVIAVGSGRFLDSGERVPLTLKAGDRVLLGKWSGTEVKIEDEDYLILKEDEILGVLS
jgi:chaperonin GroES